MTVSRSAATAGQLLVIGAQLPDWRATARIGGDHIEPGPAVDVRISGGRIVEVAAGLERHREDAVLEVPGTVVLPALHDHHLHLRSLVAAQRSVPVGPGDVDAAAGVSEALHRAPVDGRGWRRAVGYHESVAGDLDRDTLDVLSPDGPLRVQHRTGAMWILNSAAVAVLGVDGIDDPGVERDTAGRPTGRLFRMDRWLASRLGDDDPIAEVAALSLDLAAAGVAGVTDATADATPDGMATLVTAVADGRLTQRLHAMCPLEVALPAHPLVTRGPHKILLDDDRLPALAELSALVASIHDGGLAVAVHCVTGAQLTITVAALQDAGSVAGDRIEHASIVPVDMLDILAALGVTVVTNPGFIDGRGDAYLDEVDQRDLDDLYRCASLTDAGVAVGAGTDAPFGSWDPWTAIAAARTRRTRGGRVVGAGEAVSLEAAIALFAGAADAPGRPRRVAVGEPGDLCLLAGGVIPGPGPHAPVAATVVAGAVTHRSDGP